MKRVIERMSWPERAHFGAHTPREKKMNAIPILKGERTVLITGASSGIGKAFAKVFAHHGWNVALTARRQDRLLELSETLKENNGSRVTIIQADLADPQAPFDIAKELNRNDIHIDALVNNAGYGVPGYFALTDWRNQQDFLQVLVNAPTHLCHLFLPGMINNNYGRIINVASLNALLPCSPGQTLYAGAKSYIVGLSNTLAAEAGKHGVHVCAVCPGLTYTEFHDVTGTRDMVSKVPKNQWMSAQEVSNHGYRAVMRGDLMCIPGRTTRIMAIVAKILPRKMMVHLMTSQSKKIRRAE